MKFAFLGNFNVPYCSEVHHKKTLESMGHTVIPLQEGVANSEQILSAALESDAFIWVHTHGWDTPGIETVLRSLKEAGIPTLTYHLDLWFGLQRQKDIQSDPYWNIDHFFTVDPQMADWLNQNTEIKGHYLPAAVFHEEADKLYIRPKNNQVIFVGSKGYHPEWRYRPELIFWLQNVYKKHFQHFGNDGKKVVRGDELNALYQSTKVVVGDTLCIGFNYEGYWSDRVYETIGRGGFIIHPYIKGMENHFTDRQHLVFYEYGNFKQLKELIDYYLTHDSEREEIRKNGFLHVKQNHTYLNRWQEILDIIGVKDA